MISHALLLRETYRPEPRRAAAWSEKPPSLSEHPSSCEQVSGHSGFSAEAARTLDDIRRAIERNPEGARTAALRLVTLLTRPTETEPASARGGLAPWQQRKVDRYVREHLERSMWVDELAEQVSLSASHFCRAFKHSFGDTPHAYIVRLRLERAQELMLSTKDTLCQIALACGLADQAHLSKLFRREIGEPPHAWRRRNLTDAQAELRTHRSAECPQLSLRDQCA